MYEPKPIDTSDIDLPDDLVSLTEQIAENVHDVWAKNRISEGWEYGECRDDIAKTTPCLVPYDQLTEIEKNYDRATALETLKIIIKLGYIIKKDETRSDMA